MSGNVTLGKLPAWPCHLTSLHFVLLLSHSVPASQYAVMHKSRIESAARVIVNWSCSTLSQLDVLRLSLSILVSPGT